MADHARATQLGELAREIRPGTTLRIWRALPSWCSGWLEDHPIERGGLSALLDHLQSEYGGKLYRVEVLAANGRIAYESSIGISGPPRDGGKLIDREEWEGNTGKKRDAEPSRRTEAAAHGGELGIVKLLIDMTERSSQNTLTAVKEMTTETRRSIDKLVGTVVTERERDRNAERGDSLGSKLSQLARDAAELDRIKNHFARTGGAKRNEAPAAGGIDDSGDFMDKAFKTMILKKVLGGAFGGDGGQRRRRPPRVIHMQPTPAAAPPPAQSQARPRAPANGAAIPSAEEE